MLAEEAVNIDAARLMAIDDEASREAAIAVAQTSWGGEALAASTYSERVEQLCRSHGVKVQQVRDMQREIAASQAAELAEIEIGL